MDKQTRGLTAENRFLLMTLILNENQCQKFVRVSKGKDIRGGVVVIGKGTVQNPTLNMFGIKSQKKEIINILIGETRAAELLDYFTKELQLSEPGRGIVFTSQVRSADQIMNRSQDAQDGAQVLEEESMYKKLTVVVNRGVGEDVMDIARRSGVKGGTIMHGRGTGAEYTATLFGMEIEPEKELVMILMPEDIVERVVNDLYRGLELDDAGNGILFVESVVEVRGLVDLQRGADSSK